MVARNKELLTAHQRLQLRTLKHQLDSASSSSNPIITLTGDVTGSSTSPIATTLASGIDATKIGAGGVTNTEFGYLDGVTSAIQTQIDTKLASSSYTAADVLSKILTVDGSGSTLDADTLDGHDTAYFQVAGSYQPLDSDLTTIAGLTATTDSFMQAKSSAWAARTIAEVKTDLGLTGSNTGDQTITLTGDVTGSGTGSFAATIANDAVTYAKMQNVSATSRVLGRVTSGAGDTEELTLTQVLDFIGSAAQGDILYRGSSSWARLGAGTSGQILQTQGASANPQWTYPAVSSLAFSGASVYKASNLTGQNITGGHTVTWDTELYDTNGWHESVTNPSRLTIPSGVSYVILTTNIDIANILGNQWVGMRINKNGAAFQGMPIALNTVDADQTVFRGCIVSGPVSVSAGDYFEVVIQNQSDTSVDITALTSYFSIQAVG